MLADYVFDWFAHERENFRRRILTDPETEFSLSCDSGCRRSSEWLDKGYKCRHCHQIAKIARKLPLFEIEAGKNKGKKFIVKEVNCSPDFMVRVKGDKKLILYDSLRGSFFVSCVLEDTKLPTLNYISSSYQCQGGQVFRELHSKLEENPQEFTFEMMVQLLATLHFLSTFEFVCENPSIQIANEPTAFDYDGVTIRSNSCIKLDTIEDSSMTVKIGTENYRFIPVSKSRKIILLHSSQPKKETNKNEEWFVPNHHFSHLKHLGDCSLNVYLCFLKIRPYLRDQRCLSLWRELWKDEQFDQIENFPGWLPEIRQEIKCDDKMNCSITNVRKLPTSSTANSPIGYPSLDGMLIRKNAICHLWQKLKIMSTEKTSI